MKKTRYQEITITVESGKTGTVTEPVSLDQQYNRIKGVALYPITDGGLSYFDLAFRDRNKIYHDPTHRDDWTAKGEERYKPFDQPNDGRTFYLEIVLPAATTSELKFQLVFKLESDE